MTIQKVLFMRGWLIIKPFHVIIWYKKIHFLRVRGLKSEVFSASLSYKGSSSYVVSLKIQIPLALERLD